MRSTYCVADHPDVPVSSRQGTGRVTAKNRSAAVSMSHIQRRHSVALHRDRRVPGSFRPCRRRAPPCPGSGYCRGCHRSRLAGRNVAPAEGGLGAPAYCGGPSGLLRWRHADPGNRIRRCVTCCSCREHRDCRRAAAAPAWRMVSAGASRRFLGFLMLAVTLGAAAAGILLLVDWADAAWLTGGVASALVILLAGAVRWGQVQGAGDSASVDRPADVSEP